MPQLFPKFVTGKRDVCRILDWVKNPFDPPPVAARINAAKSGQKIKACCAVNEQQTLKQGLVFNPPG